MENSKLEIKHDSQKGYYPGTVIERSRDLSYKVDADGLIKRKHTDQLRGRQERNSGDEIQEDNAKLENETNREIESMSNTNNNPVADKEPDHTLTNFEPVADHQTSVIPVISQQKRLRRSERIKKITGKGRTSKKPEKTDMDECSSYLLIFMCTCEHTV
ncbi:hypothetical protein RF11_05015 [Thelohanellus kitauei]|uniref:Uncharacterized protein n=1 Tax=Thelohanellus kitauei TaxID=669202 RepID=A0A0C2M4B0_THEKT|nr:hypothetical protein RF11_05015 [Thelohanellus kitauei]